MAINDNSVRVIDMQEALIVALTELMQAEDEIIVGKLITLITELRLRHMTFMLNDALVVRHLWSDIRENQALLSSLMNTTTTFIMELSSPGEAINLLARSLVPFSVESSIVDREILGKAANYPTLQQTFSTNEWLFFLVFASTQMRLVNSVLAAAKLKGKE
ncbi:hypothetical protein AVT69_gp169 [Pseudomonas phage PhiPA3]|uniref:Uncharacterized protein 171 n=1 Tax=Pseudomonas phage PhiPA3 TaxID=998086 RepID=F8SK44_BPPA3|nr:hypothetical protein AVT69_gp169 [Pseudomonas phage PhiPA3]AEH03594.1 hypothetical protein [Pseudomonas phage PhiPA3]